MFFEICVLKNYAIFTGKHLCWIFVLIRLQASSLINCLLIDIFYLKLSLANFDYRLRISMPYSEYKGKIIQDKYGYLCLTTKVLLRLAVCPARDALPGIVYEAGYTYTS